MNYKRLRYIIIPKILWYISGRFIFEHVIDYIHCKKGKNPYWPDAESCGKKYCRYCGGELYKLKEIK